MSAVKEFLFYEMSSCLMNPAVVTLLETNKNTGEAYSRTLALLGKGNSFGVSVTNKNCSTKLNQFSNEQQTQ